MKEKISRLAKGITEEQPVLQVRPDRFEAVLEPDSVTGFALEIESLSGSSMRGFCFCDDARISFAAGSFLGRIAHQGFTVDSRNLTEGTRLSGCISLAANGGEFSVPYSFTVRSKKQALYGKNGAESEETKQEEDAEDRSDEKHPEIFPEEKLPEKETFCRNSEQALLRTLIPEDPELLQEACSLLIRENAADAVALALFEKAAASGLQLTHLYESILSAWPDNEIRPMPRELLLYFSYENQLPPRAADKLYRNILSYEPETSELYRQYEARIRDHAAKSLTDRRMNRDLAVIYDRMLYPDMIDPQTATLLPDLLEAHRIHTGNPAAVTVHVKYPQLQSLSSARLKQGQAFVPVYFDDAQISFHDADGSRVSGGSFENEKLMDRPDLLRRCFSLDAEHPMLLFSAVREIMGRGLRSEEEKKILLLALTELELEESCRGELIRTLCRWGGDTSWIDQVDVKDLDRDTGNFAFRALLESGRRKDAYLYLKSAGTEGKSMTDLSGLAAGLLRDGQKPEMPDGEPDRFFICLCKKIFDAGRACFEIMDFLADVYEGPAGEMFSILEEADRNGLPVHELPERTLSLMLFTENRLHIDEAFLIYLKKETQKEVLLRAFFTLRMTDYFEREMDVAPGVFEALTGFLGLFRNPEALPEIYFLGATKQFSKQEKLSAKEQELCQKLTDLLISRGLVFPYTKMLRKKVRIPASVCEKFYVEYIGTQESRPRMLVRLLPDDPEYLPLDLKRVFHNVYVASAVLFLGDEMHYLIYDDAFGTEPVQQGSISVKKMHGREENRFLRLNRMTKAFSEDRVSELLQDMRAYAVETEVNRELFEVR